MNVVINLIDSRIEGFAFASFGGLVTGSNIIAPGNDTNVLIIASGASIIGGR